MVFGGLRETIIVGAFTKLRQAISSFVMSVCLSVRMEQLGSHWTDFSMKFGVCGVFEYLPGEFKFDQNLTRIAYTLREDVFAFVRSS